MWRRVVCAVLFVLAFIGIDRLVGLFLNRGLNSYFGLNQHSEVLLVGHSHLMLAVDKSQFERDTHRRVSKYCREGVNVADKYEMIKQYLDSPYSDSLKVVMYGVDQFMFVGHDLSQNSYKLFYPFMDNDNIDLYIRRSTDKFDYLLHKVLCTTRYSDALINSAIRGWFNDWNNYKDGRLDVAILEKQVKDGQQRHIKFERELMGDFERTLSLLEERGIAVVLVNTPVAKLLNEFEPNEYAAIVRYFQQKAESSDMIYYWDLNPEFSDRYELFHDPIHLNLQGQKVVSNRLTELFNATFVSR